jgi:hypothetical protein
MTRSAIFASALAVMSCGPGTSESLPRGPIIDMHMHAYPAAFWGGVAPPNPVTGVPSPARTDDAILRASIPAMSRYNIVKAVISGPLELAQEYRRAAPDLVLVSPRFPGLLPFPDLSRLRAGYATGELGAMAEVLAQYEGMAPGDPALAPYFSWQPSWTSPSASTWGRPSLGSHTDWRRSTERRWGTRCCLRSF